MYTCAYQSTHRSPVQCVEISQSTCNLDFLQACHEHADIYYKYAINIIYLHI